MSKRMTGNSISTEDNIRELIQNKINGYYVLSQTNAQLVREELDALGFTRYETLPNGGVKFNWISPSNNLDWTTFDSNFQILNHISNERELSNKGLLLMNLRNYEISVLKTNQHDRIHVNRSKSMAESSTNPYLPTKSFLPETYLLDHLTDRIHFKRRFREGSTWICKPVGLSCGREVFIFRSEEQLEHLLNEYHQNARNNRYCTSYYNRLVQKYIENPLLINKHKFDIRTYFLCICTSKEILCFAAQTGYLRLSMYEYDLEDMNQFIHLTNQSIQIKDKQFSIMRNQTGMTMEEFNEYFNENIQPSMIEIEKDWVLNQLPKQITKILNQVADSVRNKLSRREGCFGFYGVDILIDEKLNCWLLELNSGPTLDMTNTALEKVIPRCVNQAINLVIESLDNYRSLGSVFPLRQSNIFTYLPTSNHIPVGITISRHIPTFPSSHTGRIHLTPRIPVPFRPYHRSSSFSKEHHRFSKPVRREIKSIEKKSKPVRIDHQSSVHNGATKMYRERLSYELTELIQMNRQSLV